MAAAQRIDSHPSVVRLFDKAAFSAARYPRLQTVFERMLVANLDALREVFAAPPQYVFKDIQAEPLGEVLDAVNEEGIAAIFSVPEWQSRVVFTVDRPFVYAITELAFGGDGSEPPYAETRRFSQIEKNVARAVLSVAAKALQSSLSPVADLTLNFERVETNLETVSIDNRDSKAVVAKFDLRAGGQTGKLQLIIPQSAIRATRALPNADSDDQPTDTPETGLVLQMRQEIDNTAVKLTAILEERQVTLGDIAALKIGQIIPLETRIDGRIRLECNNQPLFMCEIGQLEGAYTLRVDETLERPGRIAP
jgi:flagellar motor switch protein FliM